MKIRQTRIGMGVILAVLAMAAAAFGQREREEPEPPEPDARISIRQMSYHPATVTIDAGQTVRWTNDDDRDHTVTSRDRERTFRSGNLNPGRHFTFRFTRPGRYPYGCDLHPRMRGTVIVRETGE